jgi:hypothetical protein
MKPYFTSFILLIFLGITYNGWAQNEEDALRYAQQEISGTARFTAMSGAFSSLGGDLSAIGLNPAGLTTFSTNRFTGTFSFYNTENTAKYFNNHTTSTYNSSDDNIIKIDQLGVVWVYKSDSSEWNKLALSLNYNRQADYGNYLKIIGNNTAGNSMVNYFVDQANGIQLADLKVGDDETIDYVYQWLGENIGYHAQQAFLGYQAYIIDPNTDDDTNSLYNPNAQYTTVEHNNKVVTTGNKENFDLSFAGTYNDNLQLGFGLSLINIEYTENNANTETGYDAGSDLQLLKLNNILYTEGSGVQMKFGGIYKLPNNVRVSLAFHTPQWIRIEESLRQSIHTEFNNGDVIDLNPNVENAFAPYRIITPSKIIAGASFVVGKKGLISVDYSYQDYSNLRFKELETDFSSDYFDEVNDYMSQHFQATHSFNIGGELKLSELSLRGGTFFSSSPYKDSETLYASKGYSFGAGFDLGGIVLDAAFIHSENDTYKTLLALPDQAYVTQKKNKFQIGLRYDF